MDGTIPYDHDAAWQYVLRVAPSILNLPQPE